ncbi:MAG TPA: hypothetical protein VLJ86_24905, partial [Ramlibacter sp.]|nr:hypothetical protein [Ramlibacter sp.]
MVAIVSGNSLGLGLGLNPASTPASTSASSGTSGASAPGAWVNVATGNLTLQVQDDYLAARGDDAAALRTYNSQGLFDDDNADNWSTGFYTQALRLSGTLNADGSTLERTSRDGAVDSFVYNAMRSMYVGASGANVADTVTQVVGMQLEWRDGATGATQRYAVLDEMRLASSADASGNRTLYAYDALGQIARVTTASGESTFYNYQGRNLIQLRVEAQGAAPAVRTRYAYDASNRLARVVVDLTPQDSSVADGKVFETVYTYDGASLRVASLTQSDGVAMRITYVQVGGQSRVASVTDALGQGTRFSYGAGLATVTDPLGIVTRYELDPQGRVTAIVV